MAEAVRERYETVLRCAGTGVRRQVEKRGVDNMASTEREPIMGVGGRNGYSDHSRKKTHWICINLGDNLRQNWVDMSTLWRQPGAGN